MRKMVKEQMANVWSGIDSQLQEYEEKLARQDPSQMTREQYMGFTQDTVRQRFILNRLPPARMIILKTLSPSQVVIDPERVPTYQSPSRPRLHRVADPMRNGNDDKYSFLPHASLPIENETF